MSPNPTFLLLLFSLILINPQASSAQQQNFTSFSSSDTPWRADSNRILGSPKSLFASGFRPIPGRRNLYQFSVWYQNVSSEAVVWTANKEAQLGPNATLSVTAAGELRLRNSSNGSNLLPGNTTGNINTTRLTLGDEGNLVFGTWTSFHYPTDTILPNQTFSDLKTNLTSENGRYELKNSLSLFFDSSDSYWSAKEKFVKLNDEGKLDQENAAMIMSSDFGLPRLRRLTLDDDGNLRIYSYDPDSLKWLVVWSAKHELCSIHGTCGPNAICMGDGSNSTSCVCPPGFKPSTNHEPKKGCTRKIEFKDYKNTKFLRLDYVNFSAPANTNLNLQIGVQNLGECQSNCSNRQTCLGYSFKYDGTSTCILQLGNLSNGYWSPGTETAMFLRVDNSEQDQSDFKGMTEILETTCPITIELPLPPDDSNTTTRNIVIICTLFAAELISGALFFWAFLRKYIKYRDMARTLGLELLPAGGPKRFSYAELKIATKNFSNLIGKGGFGDVYKGELADHRVVAVKCLKNVAGGEQDFWAEVTIIARMHHLNLVRLWGFCAEKGQRILVYEFVPNGSLDKYLFRPDQIGSFQENEKPILDWNVRYRIALGVARSIAYLHEECLEWVLHCDIKPENILLGDDFCPKISDFGLSKLRKKEDMVSMSRMRGTRGYMAPEWVKTDTITAKADVYSFGMVLLELVSGVRNSQIQSASMESANWYFPGWAFDKVYKEVRVEELLDRHIKQSYDSRAHFDMVNRMVKTAMWCLQSRPELRPSMGKVAKMLEGTVEITEPNKPTIFFLGDD
ncbi:hypothetical protein UlMin_040700 [Ulmus minor]